VDLKLSISGGRKKIPTDGSFTLLNKKIDIDNNWTIRLLFIKIYKSKNIETIKRISKSSCLFQERNSFAGRIL
jgi:hypothetical protein